MAETGSKKPVKKVAAKTAAESVQPVARKPAAAKPASAKPAPAKALKAAAAVPAKAPVRKPVARIASKAMQVTDEQRYRMVAEAAYYRAESNHFKSDPLRDWIEAESDISALLTGGK